MGKQSADGAAIRMGGRLAIEAKQMRLTAADGGSVEVIGLVDGVEGFVGSFVEVVGTKSGAASVNAIGIVNLGEKVDVELWDEAVKLTHVPALKECFQPVSVSAGAAWDKSHRRPSRLSNDVGFILTCS